MSESGGTGQLLVHAGTFAALGPGGDITGTRGRSPDGLFVRDGRHLSRWRLLVDGAVPEVLTPGGSAGGAAVLAREGTRDEPAAYVVFRRQALYGGTLTEHTRVTSNVAYDTTLTLVLEADADFADQFELRSDRRTYPKPGAARTVAVTADEVTFHYRRSGWHSATTVSARPAPDEVRALGPTGRALVWRLVLPAHGEAELAVTVTARPHGTPATRAPGPATPEAVAHRVRREEADIRRDDLPVLPGGTGGANGTDGVLRDACAQGLADLAGLLVPARGPDGEPVSPPGAGVPWFLTLFGRDSLLTSFFALPYRPALARATLLALAATQATRYEPERVAQPGKIVHEVRHGELAHFGQVPYGRYYGSVDSTPLFLALLHAYTAHTGDPSVARRLEPQARAAVAWLLGDGGLGGRGYLVYEADEAGLLNQNWKDSAGAVCRADGTQLTGAVAVAEAQGYAYDALRGSAALAREVWHDAARAAELDALAADLRERFHRDFLMRETGFPALALDGGTGAHEPGKIRTDGPGRADVLASDAGHLLWSGILDQDTGERVGRRLTEEDFFSGWGIRTLAAGQRPYHPLSYHRGSVWPHDTAVAVLGMARYGLHREAAKVTAGLLAASEHFGHRLPEVYSGHARPETGVPGGPVPYPHANSPQAWAAATPLALLTAARAGRPGS
ncbi:amylo-alpha-1,6-glucosidase [Streptomyces sp. 8L]|uniref:amylo-alpha-1,6-glucosidase n=1 Tax=Streptomyces sp. 8L TaxID=2877242 RepID=UPI001CD7AD05|nr:glycogen debranching N-terminal domain-containing protein [Streptomyces sp. 8L]MCA1217344.1 aminotransferase [Streptomyces sp. 8L]